MRSMRCVGPSWGWWYMVWGGWWRSMVRSWWGMMRSHWSMVMRGWRMAEVGWRNRVSISAWWTVISGVLEVIMGRQTMMRIYRCKRRSSGIIKLNQLAPTICALTGQILALQRRSA